MDNHDDCTNSHAQIMAELERIHKRMDEDWLMIKETHEDLVGRQYLISAIRIIGVGTILAGLTALVVHLFK